MTTPTPHPLGATLPILFLEDSFAQRLCEGLDEVLAPDIAMLDCFGAYLDPGTTPPDLLDWLVSWMGLAQARSLPVDRRRALLGRAAALHASRGTPQSILELVEIATGFPVELNESGGLGWSPEAGAGLPGRDQPELVVRIRTGGAGSVDEALIGRLLLLVIPADLPWRLELIS